MICPKCKSKRIIKNGFTPAKKRRWKCSTCRTSFINEKKYPPTKLPFEFISLILYQTEDYSCMDTKRYATFMLRLLHAAHVAPTSKIKVAYTAVREWKKLYGPIYKKLISFKEAKKYYRTLWEKADTSSFTKRNSVDLSKIEDILRLGFGEQWSTFIRKHPEILKKLIDDRS